MPSLDDLRKRIVSVKSTQKITKAMKMVAAAKLKKAQDSAEKGRPYSKKMQNIILNLTNSVSDPENAPKLLVGTGLDKTHLCVVMTADKGLCGGFNTNICKLAKNHFEKLLKQDQYSPMTVSEQVISVFTGVKGYLDDVELNQIKKFEQDIVDKIKKDKPEIMDAIQTTGKLDEETEKSLSQIIEIYKKELK